MNCWNGILTFVVQPAMTFISVYLGYKYSLRQADDSRRREYLLKELDTFQHHADNSFMDIANCPRSVIQDDELRIKESICKEQNKNKVLETVNWIQEKQNLLNKMMICNGITGDIQRNFMQANQDIVNCLSGDDFSNANWWLPPDIRKFNMAQSYLYQSIDNLKLAVLGNKTGFTALFRFIF